MRKKLELNAFITWGEDGDGINQRQEGVPSYSTDGFQSHFMLKDESSGSSKTDIATAIMIRG